MIDREARALLADLFEVAVTAADPAKILPQYLPAAPKGRLIVIGAGKAAARMAEVVEAHYDVPLAGLVVVPDGAEVALRHIALKTASHPVPDARGLAAAQEMAEVVSQAQPFDQIIALISGGGSALLPAPADGLSLEDEIALNRALLASGAPISVMNKIRLQISTIKGGGLAALAPRTPILTLVLSDVPGDDPAEVASGPTLPRMVPRAEALALIRDWRITLPQHLQAWLEQAPERLTPQVSEGSACHVIGSARISIEAVAEAARARGIETLILSDRIEGEAREVGKVIAALAREEGTYAKGTLLLSGGETTVTLAGPGGRGGRNGEFLLSFALAAEGLAFSALAADTDGIDGSEKNAGAFADGGSAARLRALGLDARALLAAHDSYSAFEALGDLFVTGPTGTNVNDFRAILIG